MNAAPFHLGGERLLLDPSGALIWPGERLLVVADLHLEKASHFAARGQLLPPLDTGLTLDRLARLLRAYGPRCVLALGDNFHDQAGPSRLSATDQARLATIARATELIWLSGNHDPLPCEGLPGRAVTELAIGPISFRHAPLPRAKLEISGHLHPKASVAVRGSQITRPCFVADANRVLLPAFGAFTGGLDVRSPAIAGLFPRGGRAFLLGNERLFSFTLTQARVMAVE
jgi:DNA ligase-associated metallophosphoesterase